jgi:peptidoglycan-associated lipoprotein
MSIVKAFAPYAIAVALLAGCSSTPLTTPASTAAPAPQPVPATPAAPKPAIASTVAPVVLPDYLNPKSPIYTDRSFYFGFDDYAIRQTDRPLIERHGKYLLSHPSLAIRVEGNTDERGSSEYNLALGQKRAQAVLNALKIYGVKDSQMEATSWGKEKPKDPGHDESAWVQNRRVDLAYPNK